MNLRLALLAVYERDPIPVETIAGELFGLSYEVARTRITKGDFPLPAFQLADSAKAPWFVSIEDLADYIQKRRNQAKKGTDTATDLLRGNREGRRHPG